MVVTMLLDVLEPDWRAGAAPDELPDEREIKPWLDPRLRGRAVPQRLVDAPARSRTGIDAPQPAHPRRTAAAGAAIHRAVGMLREAPDSVVVLAGPGGTGAVGLAAARRLTDAGVRVTTITAEGGVVGGVPTESFAGGVPPAGCYVDALVGSGLHGRLRDGPLDMMLALRNHAAPILSVDLPSGLHPIDGLVGDVVPATVTVALAGMWPALAYVGLAPFVGDLYLWEPGDDGVVRLVGGPDRTTTDGGWRE
jgi:NAD(P)H-hydrate repair Nnr-like enzyme with NAD(P)H-hydrate epimerase domain